MAQDRSRGAASFCFRSLLCQEKEQNSHDVWILHTFSYKMINNLSSICYFNQELLRADSWYSNAVLVPVLWTLSTFLQFVPETIWHLKSKLHQFGLQVQKTARSTLHWVKRFTSGGSSKIKRDTACGSQFSETDPFL